MSLLNRLFRYLAKSEYHRGVSKGYRLGMMAGRTDTNNKLYITGSKVLEEAEQVRRNYEGN